MKICLVLFSLLCFCINAAFADSDKLFCCEDSNYQQNMLQEFDTGHGVSFNGPPGSYLKKSSGVEYDPLNKSMLAYVLDKTGRASFFPSHLHVGDCEHVAANGDGFLKCGDH